MYTPAGEVIVGHARIRGYSFPAVLDFDLADDLAHLDLAAKISRLTEGDTSVLQERSSITLATIGAGSGVEAGLASLHRSPPRSGRSSRR